MNQIANLIDHHYEQTGIHFSFASKQDQVAALDGDGPYAIRVDVERTTFFATGFSFNYRGATISGALSCVPAGYVNHAGCALLMDASLNAAKAIVADQLVIAIQEMKAAKCGRSKDVERNLTTWRELTVD